MKNTIDELWDGNISPCAQCGEDDPEIGNLLVLMEKNVEELKKEIGEAQREMLRNYAGCAEEYAYLIAKQAFSDGFSLACKLLAEALVGEKCPKQTVS